MESKKNINKYCLGTAQLGIKGYGINNYSIHLPCGDSFFDLILKEGLTNIDTSVYYGEIEKVIFNYNKKSKLQIYTKIGLKHSLQSFLNNTGLKKVKGCYIHHFDDYQTDSSIFDLLKEQQLDGMVDEVGFSIYHESELLKILEEDLNIQIIQLPHNIFDQRFEIYFPILKQKNIKVITRSCFLQGMFFKTENYFEDSKMNNYISKKIDQLRLISEEYMIPISQLCYQFSATNPYIDNVIIGTDKLEQLEYNLKQNKLYNGKLSSRVMEKLYALKETNLNIILPFLWNK